ncbi:MAG: helix-turn-helix domain-containing protein, partial [Marinoscillum sp.]
LKLIFGLKLKEIRNSKGISYQELREKTGLSLSYLSEIENGKKYPKGDKIISIANALDVSYDDLVSLKVPKKLEPVVNLIQSDFFNAFPLEQFGLNPQKLVEIISYDPVKINAFVNTILQVARNFELKQESFYYTALRSYQELHNNYFEELEEAVDELHLEFPELKEIPFNEKVLTEILLKIGVRCSSEEMREIQSLKNLRSLYDPTQRLLHINDGLNSGQINFLLGREIAFQWTREKERPLATPPQGNHSFEQILSNYRASYFSAALMMPRDEVVADIERFGQMAHWDPKVFLSFLDKYDVTPEMIMQRLTNILPTLFGYENLFFLRFVGKGSTFFTLSKELHLTKLHNPHGNELNEHYCRRWISLSIIQDLNQKLKKNPKVKYVAGIQRSRYHESPNEYLCLSIAFPNVSNPEEAVSVTIGFLVDDNLNRRIKFLNDEKIPARLVHTTCERCPIMDCKERAVEPYVFKGQEENEEILRDIDRLLEGQ